MLQENLGMCYIGGFTGSAGIIAGLAVGTVAFVVVALLAVWKAGGFCPSKHEAGGADVELAQ